MAVRQGSESCELSKIGHQGGKFNAASENMAPLLFVGSTNIYSEMYDDIRNAKNKAKLGYEQNQYQQFSRSQNVLHFLEMYRELL